MQKSLNSMKQKVKKQKPTYAKEIENFRAVNFSFLSFLFFSLNIVV